MKFKKKPVVIEAVQFTGNNLEDIEMLGCQPVLFGTDWTIITLEGNMSISIGDWVIKGVKGEFYPCKPDIFEATYEPVDD